MIIGPIDAEASAAIPAEVVGALGLKPGDEVGFDIADGVVSLFRNRSDEEMDEETGLTIAELRAFVAEGSKGPYIPAEEAFARLRAHAAAARSAAG